MSIGSLCIAFCLLLAGCSAANTSVSGQAELQITASGQENKGTAQKPLEGDENMYTYTTQEIWVRNGDMNIYGIAYVPDTKEKSLLVIFSHELGNDHTSGERYAQRLAEAGYGLRILPK